MKKFYDLTVEEKERLIEELRGEIALTIEEINRGKLVDRMTNLIASIDGISNVKVRSSNIR